MRYLKTQKILALVLLLISIFSFRSSAFPNLIYYNMGNIFHNFALTIDHTSSGYAGKAETAFRQVGILQNQEAYSHLMQKTGVSLLLQNDKEESFSILREIQNGDDYLLQLGHNAYAKGDYDQAIYWFEIIVEIWPEQHGALFFLGRSYSKQGNMERALIYYEIALSAHTVMPTNVTTAEIYCVVGWSYHWLMEEKDPTQALIYYNLGIASDSAKSYNELDDCYFKRGSLLMGYFDDTQGAIADFEFATMFNPENVHAQANLILANNSMTGDFESAEQKLLQLIEREPESVYGYWRLGDLYLDEKRNLDAYVQYVLAIKHAPNNQQLQQIVQNLAP